MVASVRKRRKQRRKKGNDTKNPGKIKCRATKNSWSKKLSLKQNFQRLGLKADPNDNIRDAQVARNEKIRQILHLEQAKSNLKWKLKRQAQLLHQSESKLQQMKSNSNSNSNSNSSNNTNNSSNNNNCNSSNNKQNNNNIDDNKRRRVKRNWMLPSHAPQIDSNGKQIGNNKNNNKNNDWDMERLGSMTKSLKASENQLKQEMKFVKSELDALAKSKMDGKLQPSEKITFEKIAAAKMAREAKYNNNNDDDTNEMESKRKGKRKKRKTTGGTGAILPDAIASSVLKRQMELAVNAEPRHVKTYLAQHLKEYYQRLIYAYGRDFKAMSRDTRLNTWQYTENRITKDITRNQHVFFFPQQAPGDVQKL